MTRPLLLAALAVMAAATVAWLAKSAANSGRVSRREYVGTLTPHCRHEDMWFDRTLCACGWMHDVCADCGQQWPDCEPDDGIQPPDPRPVTLASGPLEPVDATRWTVTGASHESQTRVGDWG